MRVFAHLIETAGAMHVNARDGGEMPSSGLDDGMFQQWSDPLLLQLYQRTSSYSA